MTSDPALARIADALDRLSPKPAPPPSFAEAEAYAWHTGPDRLEPVRRVALPERLPAYLASALVAALALFAGPLLGYARGTADDLGTNTRYILGVLGDGPLNLPTRPKGDDVQEPEDGK